MRSLAQKKRDAYITTHQNFVSRLASRVQRQYGLPECMLEDLEAAGYVGLVEAANRYKVSKNNKFTSYAFYRIRGAIIDEVRKMGSGAVSFKRAYKTLKTANEVFFESATNYQISQSDAALAGILEILGSVVIAHKLTGNDQIEYLLDNKFQDDINQNIEREYLEILIQKLPLKQQQVIRGYYFKDMDYAEISRFYKISSKSWVSRLHLIALKNMKKLYEQQNSK